MKHRSLLSTMAIASALVLSGTAAHAGCGPKCKGKCSASEMPKCSSREGKHCAAKHRAKCAGSKGSPKDGMKCGARTKCAPKCAGK